MVVGFCKRFGLLALVAGAALLVSPRADAAITLDFSSALGSTIKFAGDGSSTTITLTPGTNPLGGNPGLHDFQITNVFGGTGTAVGLFGDITGSGFTYSAADIVISGSTQEASLGGVGNQLKLGPDGGGDTLTADIAGVQVMTSGTAGAINFIGMVNLSNLSYSGTNSDLLQLLNEATGSGNGGIVSLSFTFVPPQTLTALLGPGTNQTSYSGRITTTPEPATIAMVASLLPILGVVQWRRRRGKQD